MRFPSISTDTAHNQWTSHNNGGGTLSFTTEIDYIGDEGLEDFNDLELEDLIEELDVILKRYQAKQADKPTTITAHKFDSEIVAPIHKYLSQHLRPDQLCDIGFWRWLSNVAGDGFFWKLIYWRFLGGKKGKYKPGSQVNWAIISGAADLKESYLFRSWVRGHLMHDPTLSDPYESAKKGTADVWRSHILRQDWGKDQTMVRAFLDFNFASDGKRLIPDPDLREILIPGLRFWTSKGSFSHLSYEECTDLIKEIWENEIAQ
jgi:hypothetical protein